MRQTLPVFILLCLAATCAFAGSDEADRKRLEARRELEAEKQLRDDAIQRIPAEHLLLVSRAQQDRLAKRLNEYLADLTRMNGRKQIHPIVSGAVVSEYYRLMVDTLPRLRDREAHPEKLKELRLRYQLVNEIVSLEALDFLISYGRSMMEESNVSSTKSLSERRHAAMQRALTKSAEHVKHNSIFYSSEALIVAASENGLNLGHKLEYLYRQPPTEMSIKDGLTLADTLAALTYKANATKIPAWKRALALVQK